MSPSVFVSIVYSNNYDPSWFDSRKYIFISMQAVDKTRCILSLQSAASFVCSFRIHFPPLYLLPAQSVFILGRLRQNTTMLSTRYYFSVFVRPRSCFPHAIHGDEMKTGATNAAAVCGSECADHVTESIRDLWSTM